MSRRNPQLWKVEARPRGPARPGAGSPLVTCVRPLLCLSPHLGFIQLFQRRLGDRKPPARWSRPTSESRSGEGPRTGCCLRNGLAAWTPRARAGSLPQTEAGPHPGTGADGSGPEREAARTIFIVKTTQGTLLVLLSTPESI